MKQINIMEVRTNYISTIRNALVIKVGKRDHGKGRMSSMSSISFVGLPDLPSPMSKKGMKL